MGTTITLWNIIGKAVDAFLKRVVPLQGNLYTNTIGMLSIKVQAFVKRLFIGVEIFHKGRNTPFIAKQFLTTTTLIFQQNGNAGIQK